MTRPDIPVTISGDPRGFERSLDRVRRATKTSAADVAASFMRVKAAAAGVVGVVAAIGGSALVAATTQAIQSVNELSRAARTAGVDFESFQTLKYAAEQNLVGVDALTDGLKEMQLRADEFVKTGAGSAAESFARLGMDANDVAERLKDPAKMFETIIDRIKQMDKAAQIRILDELFGGTAAEQFTQFLGEGIGQIGRLRKEAESIGIVMDDSFVEKAEEAERKFNALATVVGVNLKSAIISAASSLFEFVDSFRDFQNQQNKTLQNRQAELGMQRVDLENTKLQIGDGQPMVTRKIDEQLRLLAEEEARIVDVLSTRLNEPKPVNTDPWKPKDTPNTSPAQEKARSKAAAEAEKERKAYEGVIESLREELTVMGLSETDRERILTLRKAGVEASSQEGQEILKLLDLKQQQEKAEESLQETRERAAEAAERLGQTLDDQLLRVVDGTFDARDALASLLSEMINISTQGKGLFGTLFSTFSGGSGFNLFGGGSAASSSFKPNTTLGAVLGYGGARAGGGDVSPGRIYRINEYEDEVFAPTNHGRIIAPSKLNSSGDAAGGSAGVLTIELAMSADVEARIMKNTSDNTVTIVRSNNVAQKNYRQNGGEY